MVSVTNETTKLLEAALAAATDCWLANSNGALFDEAFDPESGKPEIRNFTTMVEMLFNYIEERRGFLQSRDFQLLSIEQPFAVPLDPDRPGLTYVGRLDKKFHYKGAIYAAEHKTTTLYKKDGFFRSDFIDSFSPSSQIDGYLYALHLLHGRKAKAVWVDAALVHGSVHNGFRFISVDRAFEQLAGWVWETRFWVSMIESQREALGASPQGGSNFEHQDGIAVQDLPYMPSFPKNTEQCTMYGNCTYIDLCKMWSNPEAWETPPGFTVSHWSPFDELDLASIKKSMDPTADETTCYDNTRISCFRRCNRMYYYRHVRDLLSESDRRALLFGSAWHAAMDVVWRTLARKGKDFHGS